MVLRVPVFLCALIAVMISLASLARTLTIPGQTYNLQPVAANPISSPTAPVAPDFSLKSLVNHNFVHLSSGWEWDATGAVAYSRFNDAVLEGTFVGTSLDLLAQLHQQLFDFSLDGTAPVQLTTPTAPDFSSLKLVGGIEAGRHNFRLHLVNRAGQPLVVQGLRSDGPFVASQFNSRPELLGFGSSSIDFCGITWQVSQALNWETVNRGIGGTTVINEGQYRVSSDVLPFQPNIVLLNYGSNDWYLNLPLEQFRVAYNNMLRQLNQGLPQTEFVVLGLFPRKDGNEATRPQYNQAIKDAIKTSGLESRTRYVEVGGYNWATDTLEGTHPNPASVSTKFVPPLLAALKSFGVS